MIDKFINDEVDVQKDLQEQLKFKTTEVGSLKAQLAAVQNSESMLVNHVDELKAQLAAAHESRIDFVEYARKVESGEFVLVPRGITCKTLDRLFAEHDLDEDRATYIYKDIINAAQGESHD